MAAPLKDQRPYLIFSNQTFHESHIFLKVLAFDLIEARQLMPELNK